MAPLRSRMLLCLHLLNADVQIWFDNSSQPLFRGCCCACICSTPTSKFGSTILLRSKSSGDPKFMEAYELSSEESEDVLFKQEMKSQCEEKRSEISWRDAKYGRI